MELTHKCNKCLEIKEVKLFTKNATKRGYANTCLVCTKIRVDRWISQNLDKNRAYKSAWKKANKPKSNESTRIRNKIRYATDINYKMKVSLRNRFREVMLTKKRSKSALKLLGCTLDFFKGYIESQFDIGMNWENHAQFGWHIDHIEPLCSFDLTKPEEQEKAFHYTNLRPLWWDVNLGRNKPKLSTQEIT